MRQHLRLLITAAAFSCASSPAFAQQSDGEIAQLRAQQAEWRAQMDLANANIGSNYPQMAADMVARLRMREAAISHERYRRAAENHEQEVQRAADAQAQYEEDLRSANEARARYEAEMAEYRRQHGGL